MSMTPLRQTSFDAAGTASIDIISSSSSSSRQPLWSLLSLSHLALLIPSSLVNTHRRRAALNDVDDVIVSHRKYTDRHVTCLYAYIGQSTIFVMFVFTLDTRPHLSNNFTRTLKYRNVWVVAGSMLASCSKSWSAVIVTWRFWCKDYIMISFLKKMVNLTLITWVKSRGSE